MSQARPRDLDARRRSRRGDRLAALVVMMVAIACGPPPGEPSHEHAADHEGAHDHGHGHDDGRGSVVATVWTDDTELFVELPRLVLGQDSPFAAHLTWLEGFGPVDAGRVTVVLSGGGAPQEQFSAEPSPTPGIFRPVVRPAHAATRTVTVILEVDERRWEHVLGEHRVVESQAELPALVEQEADGAIAFLKEQQWRMAFSTEVATRGPMRPSVPAFAHIVPRADGEVMVSAPSTGRLVPTAVPMPVVGSHVDSGDVLARFVPRLEGAADVASLDLAVVAARLDLEQATRERERLEGLLREGAVPERRVVEARHEEDTARATLDAAQRRIGQFRRVQRTGGRGDKSNVEIRTPLAGTVLEVRAVAGALVEDGAPLFRIVDERSLWLSVRVPEIDAPVLDAVTGAWFRLDAAAAPIEVGADAIVTRGRLVDPRTRTVDVIFVVPNDTGSLRVGARVQAHLWTGEPVQTVSVPAAAVLLEAGLSLVFVQTGGESFERRQVRTGMRDRDRIEIVDGLAAGERVVVEGAYAVDLAASSTAVPSHGHAH